jgi:hypothetical protein
VITETAFLMNSHEIETAYSAGAQCRRTMGIHLARRAKRNSARTSQAANDGLTNHGTPSSR